MLYLAFFDSVPDNFVYDELVIVDSDIIGGVYFDQNFIVGLVFYNRNSVVGPVIFKNNGCRERFLIGLMLSYWYFVVTDSVG